MHAVEMANASHKLGHELKGWYYNDGAGLETADECTVLADAIEDVCSRLVGEQPALEHLKVTHAVMAVFGQTSPEPAKFDPEHVREFVTFLRECRGFEIW